MSSKRLDFIDLARGVAVVLMVLWHSADSWIVQSARTGGAWLTLVYLGGMAAPLFTSLAGVAVGLRAFRVYGQGHTQDAQALRGQIGRGLELVILGYALRLQMWTIDGGGIRTLWGAIVWVPGVMGVFACLAAAKRLEHAPKQAAIFATFGVALYTFALIVLGQRMPERQLGLLRVDVLQCIGASLVILALLDRMLRKSIALCLSVGLAIALTTPHIEPLLPGVLPSPLAAYIARWPVAPSVRAMAGFPLFPWLAYGLIGRAVGLTIAQGAANNRLQRTLMIALCIGLLLSVASNETLQSHFGTLTRAPWLVYAVRVTARLGNLLAMLGIAAVLANLEKIRTSFVHVLGQSSLFVYWVHMEFAYGVSAKGLKQQLSLSQWLVGFLALVAAMTVLVYVKRHPKIDALLDRGDKWLEGARSPN